MPLPSATVTLPPGLAQALANSRAASEGAIASNSSNWMTAGANL